MCTRQKSHKRVNAQRATAIARVQRLELLIGCDTTTLTSTVSKQQLVHHLSNVGSLLCNRRRRHLNEYSRRNRVRTLKPRRRVSDSAGANECETLNGLTVCVVACDETRHVVQCLLRVEGKWRPIIILEALSLVGYNRDRCSFLVIFASNHTE